MLEELVGVDDVELGVGELELVDVAGDEGDVVDSLFRGVGSRVFEDAGFGVESDHFCGRDRSGEAGGDRSGTTADVEQAYSGLEP